MPLLGLLEHGIGHPGDEVGRDLGPVKLQELRLDIADGTAMLAAETVEGLERLGVVHHTTLPYSPEQNGKQESFWGQIEGRLLPMLEGEPELSLDLLNTATQAWVEEEYQRKVHSEIREAPLERYLRGPSVGRESPSSDALRRAFRTEVSRKQRRSDGTVTVEGVRFEVPAAYRNLSVHKLVSVRQRIEAVGAKLLFLPPYSPDYSPIEPAWSKVKALLRKAAARTYDALLDAVANALRAVTSGDARGWFGLCGYVPCG